MKDTHHQVPSKAAFKITPKHVDSNGNFSKLELLERAIKRDNQRLHRLSTALTSPNEVGYAPIFGRHGAFLVTLAIGTPPMTYSAILDSGSDLIWVQCQPRSYSSKLPTLPIFDPQNSSTFSKVPCSSDMRRTYEGSKCDNNSCKYLVNYGDRSSTEGVLATETFVFDQLTVPKLGFGCGNENKGMEEAGLDGIGRGQWPVISHFADQFGQFLLLLNLRFLKNPYNMPSFYHLSLEAITVGDTLLDIP
ncbi:hypothetical protein Sjap_013686 [Stephania japonica]|uniref:Peptidase A1 domain-containing protein n=1 Tax=Stephania japonica TaxID=461633 RepID=A0AAP0IYC4_9MAGN